MKIKKSYQIIAVIVLVLLLGLLTLSSINSYCGWYAYKKWKYRAATGDINDSKRRHVFVKELHFKVDSFSGKIENFHAYIERGFHFSHISQDDTEPLNGSKYPFQLSYTFYNTSALGIMPRKSELKKFDSSDAIWGYLKSPILKDTVIVDLVGENIHAGIIKIWE